MIEIGGILFLLGLATALALAAREDMRYTRECEVSRFGSLRRPRR